MVVSQRFLLLVALVVEWPLAGSQDGKVDGGWGPWSSDADIDCCAFGGDERHKRVCDNPLPQNGGEKCETVNKQTNNKTLVLVDYKWTTCDCENCHTSKLYSPTHIGFMTAGELSF